MTSFCSVFVFLNTALQNINEKDNNCSRWEGTRRKMECSLSEEANSICTGKTVQIERVMQWKRITGTT